MQETLFPPPHCVCVSVSLSVSVSLYLSLSACVCVCVCMFYSSLGTQIQVWPQQLPLNFHTAILVDFRCASSLHKKNVDLGIENSVSHFLPSPVLLSLFPVHLRLRAGEGRTPPAECFCCHDDLAPCMEPAEPGLNPLKLCLKTQPSSFARYSVIEI